MDYSKYNRYAAILESAVLDQEPAAKFYKDPVSKSRGYIRLETGNSKGVLHCSAENLRYYEKQGYLYKLILLGKKDSRIIFANAGAMNVSRGGRGEIAYRFNPLNMDGNGHGLHEFSAAVIAGISAVDADEDMYPVLMCQLPLINGAEKEPELIDVEAFFRGEAAAEEPVEEKAEPVSPGPKPVKAAEAAVRPKQASGQTYNHYYNEFIRTSCVHMQKVSDLYEVITPFGSGGGDIHWYKVLNIMSLPFINTTGQMASSDYFRTIRSAERVASPSCQDLAARYRHFIFGMKETRAEEKNEKRVLKYYFGIPGTYSREEQPDGGKSGFRYWQPLSGGKLEKDAYGYWLAAIDATTGDVEEIVPAEGEQGS